jgi:hypothetical protein
MKQLSEKQINSFINNGFVKIERAFPTEVADECRDILWQATQCAPNNPASWTKPIIRIGPLLTRKDFNINKIDTQISPVEKAILTGLKL